MHTYWGIRHPVFAFINLKTTRVSQISKKVDKLCVYSKIMKGFIEFI